MQREASRPSGVLVVKRQNLVLSTKYRRSSTFSFNEGSSLFFAVYGSAGLYCRFLLINAHMVSDIDGVYSLGTGVCVREGHLGVRVLSWAW